MEFKITTNKSIDDIMRQIGYQPAYFQNDGEFSMVRKLTGNDYPRFHLYVKGAPLRQGSEGQMNGKSYIFSIHLDQKKPSYSGSHKHSGEYEGEVVEGEMERIKDLLH